MVRVVAAFAADERYTNMLRITIQPLIALLTSQHADVVSYAAHAVASLARSEPNRDALREAGAMRRMSELLLHTEESVQEHAVQAVANLGVDMSDALTYLRAGWHLPLIALLSAPSFDTSAAAAAVLGSLACSSDFRVALMADGALQPILQLLHAPSLPARTAAVRALAIMAQQLMSPAIPMDDPTANELVDALFDTAAVPKLLEVLIEPPPAAGAAGGMPHGGGVPGAGGLLGVDPATMERQLVAVLLLLQTLAGGHGHVRPRLVGANAVETLLGFLRHRAASQQQQAASPYQGSVGGRAPPAGSQSAAEIDGAAGTTLALLMLAPEGPARLMGAGGPTVLLSLLRTPRAPLQAAIARALGNLAHDGFPPESLLECLAPLVAMAQKPKPEVALDVYWAVSNLHRHHRSSSRLRDALTPQMLAALAAGALSGLTTFADEPRALATALVLDLASTTAGRVALRAADGEAALVAAHAAAAAAGTGAGALLDLILGLLRVPDAAPPKNGNSPAPRQMQPAAPAPAPVRAPAPVPVHAPPPPQHTPPPPQYYAPVPPPPPPPPPPTPQASVIDAAALASPPMTQQFSALEISLGPQAGAQFAAPPPGQSVPPPPPPQQQLATQQQLAPQYYSASTPPPPPQAQAPPTYQQPPAHQQPPPPPPPPAPEAPLQQPPPPPPPPMPHQPPAAPGYGYEQYAAGAPPAAAAPGYGQYAAAAPPILQPEVAEVPPLINLESIGGGAQAAASLL